MRTALRSAAVLVFVLAAEARADCTWTFAENISDPAIDNADDTGSSGLSFWSWWFTYYADQFVISGGMGAMDVFASTSLSKADSGNGTYTVSRVSACADPVEDIEAYARNEFKGTAHLDDDNEVSCVGHLKINGGQCTLLCESSGGVTLSNHELETGHTSGTIELEIWGITVSVQWALGGGDDLAQVFSDNDTGTGGQTPEVFTCHTDLQMDVNISDSNGSTESGHVLLSDAAAELKVWGTCNGRCQAIQLVVQESRGY